MIFKFVKIISFFKTFYSVSRIKLLNLKKLFIVSDFKSVLQLGIKLFELEN